MSFTPPHIPLYQGLHVSASSICGGRGLGTQSEEISFSLRTSLLTPADSVPAPGQSRSRCSVCDSEGRDPIFLPRNFLYSFLQVRFPWTRLSIVLLDIHPVRHPSQLVLSTVILSSTKSQRFTGVLRGPRPPTEIPYRFQVPLSNIQPPL